LSNAGSGAKRLSNLEAPAAPGNAKGGAAQRCLSASIGSQSFLLVMAGTMSDAFARSSAM